MVTIPIFHRRHNWCDSSGGVSTEQGKTSSGMPTTGHGSPSVSFATASEVALKSGLK